MGDDWWGVEVRDARRRKRSATTDVHTTKQRVSMRDLLGRYGADIKGLETKGHGWVSIKCPFHPDSKPSASIHNTRDKFRCHQCDVAGDVIDVVSTVEGLTIREAIEWLNKTF